MEEEGEDMGKNLNSIKKTILNIFMNLYSILENGPLWEVSISYEIKQMNSICSLSWGLGFWRGLKSYKCRLFVVVSKGRVQNLRSV